MKGSLFILIIILGACNGLLHHNESETVEKLLQEGFRSDAREDYRTSILIYDSILQIKPDQYIALVNRGRAKINLGDTAAGLANLRYSIKIHPTGSAFASKAVVELNNEPQQALIDLRNGDRLMPGKPMIISLLAYYYTAIQPIRDSALHYADYTCRLSVTDPVYYNVAMNAYMCFDDYPGLLETSDSLIAHFPKSPYPYNNRGLAKLNLGDIREAKQDIRTSLNLDSSNAWAYRNMGLVFEKLNGPDSSCFYFQKARRKDKKRQYKRDIDSLILLFCNKK
ncbi:MAG TPA: hypothetical protein VGM30_08500 [Puia sp.]|jgi:tetratricopeptide (TPR) repeat protein